MSFDTTRKIAIGTIVALVIVLGVLCVFLVREYQNQHAADILRARHVFQRMPEPQGPLGANEVTTISEWMTFDFINHVFVLPSDYLKNDLQITNAKYPNISLREYARVQGIDEASVVSRVQELVATYENSKQ
jgi:hypothetical protein